MAFNALGESDALMSLIPTVAKHELDPPNQPYNIYVVDYDKKWAKLEWTVPPGPRPTKYIVEKVETFLIPKDEPEEAEHEQEDGDEGFVAKPAVPKAAPEAGVRKEQEYVEYSTGWMHAGTTEDDTPEIKLTDLQEGYRLREQVCQKHSPYPVVRIWSSRSRSKVNQSQRRPGFGASVKLNHLAVSTLRIQIMPARSQFSAWSVQIQAPSPSEPRMIMAVQKPALR